MYDIMQLTQQVYHNLSSFLSVGCIIHEVVRTLCASMDKTIWPLGDRREVQPSKGSRMKAPQEISQDHFDSEVSLHLPPRKIETCRRGLSTPTKYKSVKGFPNDPYKNFKTLTARRATVAP